MQDSSDGEFSLIAADPQTIESSNFPTINVYCPRNSPGKNSFIRSPIRKANATLVSAPDLADRLKHYRLWEMAGKVDSLAYGELGVRQV